MSCLEFIEKSRNKCGLGLHFQCALLGVPLVCPCLLSPERRDEIESSTCILVGGKFP